jgi:hypothetical protein
MTTTTNASKTQRLLETLQEGVALTPNQIRSRFGLTHPSSVIRNLRFSGYPIFFNERKNSKGQLIGRYRLGSAPRRVVAAGYRALASA